LIYGMQKQLSGKIGFEIYFGAGFMHRNVDAFNVEYDSTKYMYISANRHNIFNIGAGNLTENNGWQPNVTTGLRVAIKLN
jgi:hypothetical protein